MHVSPVVGDVGELSTFTLLSRQNQSKFDLRCFDKNVIIFPTQSLIKIMYILYMFMPYVSQVKDKYKP